MNCAHGCEGSRGLAEWEMDLRTGAAILVRLKPCPVHGSPPYSGGWDGLNGPVVAILTS